MGIEPRSSSSDVVESAKDKCKDRPKPSKMEVMSFYSIVG